MACFLLPAFLPLPFLPPLSSELFKLSWIFSFPWTSNHAHISPVVSPDHILSCPSLGSHWWIGTWSYYVAVAIVHPRQVWHWWTREFFQTLQWKVDVCSGPRSAGDTSRLLGRTLCWELKVLGSGFNSVYTYILNLSLKPSFTHL